MPEAGTSVDILLTRSSYEQKILAHSQYVRWLQAIKCYCLDETGEVDPNCDACRGRKYIYRVQNQISVIGENSPHCADRVYPINTPIDSVQAVRYCNDEYNIVKHDDKEIVISLANVTQRYADPGEQIEVEYTVDVSNDYDGVASYIANSGVVRVPLPPIRFRDGSVQGEITVVTEVKNVTQDITYTVTGFYKNEVFITVGTEPDPGDVFNVIVKYVNPFSFLLQGVDEKINNEDGYVIQGGDAMLSVPYNYYIGDGDVIVQLVGEQRGDAVIEITTAGEDELPAFDVSQILKVVDDSSNTYVFNTDFILIKGNIIKWITANRPAEKYSIQFMYHPAFKIFRMKPNVRTPENQKLPRHAGLVIFDKINVNLDLHL